ncbi:hypothetical protein COHCIP112018_02387 [Cohnella sp. JJ-181]|nr:hypothetical protein COHCIP112018_02387 [Cohnella sp. JJ-181]
MKKKPKNGEKTKVQKGDGVQALKDALMSRKGKKK